MNYNRVILGGYLTRDPELRYTPKGTAVAKLGVAVNREWKNEAGEKQTEATFVDVEAWGKQAEVMGQYFRKGSGILVEGRLKLDTWEDKQTHKQCQKLKVVLESFSFVDRKGKSEAEPAPRAVPPKAPPTPASAPTSEPEEDDVPF